MTITAVALGGTALDLDAVEYAISIAHGRSTITDGPASMNCRIRLVTVDGVLPSVTVSDALTIDAYSSRRFTGVVSDAVLSHDPATGRGFLELSGTGPVSDLGLIPITPSAWPSEVSADRAARILTAAGITSYDTTGTLTVLAQTSDETNALDLLTSLATDTGAAVFDTPAGAVVFQDLNARAQSYVDDTWATVTGIWSAQTVTWADAETPAAAPPITLPSSAVAWEPSLEEHRGDIVNRVTIEYGTGTPRPTHTEDDTVSQAAHKIRAASMTTELATLTDAQTRAELVLERLSTPRYQMGGVSILVDDLTVGERADVLTLTCGSRVVLADLPQPSPVTSWLGVVEGWQESYDLTYWDESQYQARHVITLALSDPRASYATVKWSEVTGTRTWANIEAGLIWADATTDNDLAA
jgi:hypothetical protein